MARLIIEGDISESEAEEIIKSNDGLFMVQYIPDRQSGVRQVVSDPDNGDQVFDPNACHLELTSLASEDVCPSCKCVAGDHRGWQRQRAKKAM